MKFFLIEVAEGNRIPYGVNRNRAIDIRLLTSESFHKLPMWNLIEMQLPWEPFLPDLLLMPCVLLSKCFMETALMYQPDLLYKGVKLWDQKSGINATYFLPVIEEVECFSDQCHFSNMGNRVTELVLEEEKISSFPLFRIKGYDRKCLVGRLDFVESLLRRGVKGVTMTEVKLSNLK